jgi:hypothetical protein
VDEQEPFTRCPDCDARIDPNDPDAIYAVEKVEIVAMGPTFHSADVIGGYFHASCSPEAAGYARRPRPAPDSSA